MGRGALTDSKQLFSSLRSTKQGKNLPIKTAQALISSQLLSNNYQNLDLLLADLSNPDSKRRMFAEHWVKEQHLRLLKKADQHLKKKADDPWERKQLNLYWASQACQQQQSFAEQTLAKYNINQAKLSHRQRYQLAVLVDYLSQLSSNKQLSVIHQKITVEAQQSLQALLIEFQEKQKLPESDSLSKQNLRFLAAVVDAQNKSRLIKLQLGLEKILPVARQMATVNQIVPDGDLVAADKQWVNAYFDTYDPDNQLTNLTDARGLALQLDKERQAGVLIAEENARAAVEDQHHSVLVHEMIHQTQPISKENDHHKLLPSTKDKETNQEQMALTIDSDLVEGTTQALANYRVFQQASYSIQEDTGLRDIYKEEQDLIRCLRKAAAPDQPVEEFLTDFSAMTTVQKVDHLAKKLLPKEKDLLKAKQSGLLNDLEVPEFPDWQSRRHLMSALIVEIKNRVVYKHNPLTPKSLAQIMETGETEASVKSIIQPYFDRIS